jgi:hypothetical protein
MTTTDTCNQVGEFYVGTVGYPLRIALLGLSNDEIASIESVDLTFQRQDSSKWTYASAPSDIIDGALQYIFRQGDLTLGGTYRYKATFNMTGGRKLTGGGHFNVKMLIR